MSRFQFFALAMAATAMAACGGGTSVRSADAGPSNSGGADAGPSNSGGADAGPTQQAPSHTTTGKSWTVMVYMLADNSLEQAGGYDLLEMMKTGPATGFNIVALVDRAAPGVQGDVSGGIGGLPDWTTGKYLKVKSGSLQEVQDLGETDMGNPATLASFIEWAAKAAPADRYALVLWDHGGAWSRFGVDEGNGNSGLDLPHLKQGLADGMQRAGIKQFGIIGFDACLMSTLETALAVRSYGEYLVASEEVEPGHGWDYESFKVARDTPSINALELSKAIVSGFYAQAQQQKDSDAVTLAVTDLYALEPLVGAVKDLAAALAKVPATVGKVREQTLKFGDDPNPKRATNQVDLGDSAARLASADSSLSPQVSAVRAALGKAVLDMRNGSSKSRATGLSVFFPPNTDYYGPYRTAYEQLADSSIWRGFLESYLGQGANIAGKPQFTDPNHQGTLEYDSVNSKLTLSGTLAAGTFANVVDVTLSYGVVISTNPQQIAFGGNRPGSLDASTGIASGEWGVNALQVSQGTVSDYGYLSVRSADGGNILVQIPLAYTPPAATSPELIILAVVLDPAGNELSRNYYEQSSGAWSELVLDSTGQLQTVLLVATNSGGSWSQDWYAQAKAFDASTSLDLSLVQLDSGTQVLLSLVATDFGGNSDAVVGSGKLP